MPSSEKEHPSNPAHKKLPMYAKHLLCALSLTLSVLCGDRACAEVSESWVARTEGGESAAIAVGESHNVFVTGELEGDYGTVRYDSMGETVWIATYNGGGDGVDTAVAIALDADGNVHITGRSARHTRDLQNHRSPRAATWAHGHEASEMSER